MSGLFCGGLGWGLFFFRFKGGIDLESKEERGIREFEEVGRDLVVLNFIGYVKGWI